MLCVLVLILTKYMVQCGMLFVNNFVFIIFKTCKSLYKNNTIVHSLAMGVWDHVSCEHFEKLKLFSVLMHILKTFVLIHFCFCLLINTDIE